MIFVGDLKASRGSSRQFDSVVPSMIETVTRLSLMRTLTQSIMTISSVGRALSL